MLIIGIFRQVAKKIKNLFVVYTGIAHVFRYLNRRKAIILTYHLVQDSPPTPSRPVCWISSLEFRKHMEWLTRHYRVVPLSTIVNCVRNKEAFPERCLAVTFDDGFKSFFHTAYPVLDDMKIPTTGFISSGLIGTKKMFWFDRVEQLIVNAVEKKVSITIDGKEYELNIEKKGNTVQYLVSLLKRVKNDELEDCMELLQNKLGVKDHEFCSEDYFAMSWDEVKQISSDLFINIGSHTLNHVILTSLTEEQLKDELVVSKENIEKHIEIHVSHFSYPNGQPEDFNRKIKGEVEKAGYLSACTTIEDFNTRDTDVFELRRFGASLPLLELKVLLSGLDGLVKRLLRYVANKRPQNNERRIS